MADKNIVKLNTGAPTTWGNATKVIDDNFEEMIKPGTETQLGLCKISNDYKNDNVDSTSVASAQSVNQLYGIMDNNIWHKVVDCVTTSYSLSYDEVAQYDLLCIRFDRIDNSKNVHLTYNGITNYSDIDYFYRILSKGGTSEGFYELGDNSNPVLRKNRMFEVGNAEGKLSVYGFKIIPEVI